MINIFFVPGMFGSTIEFVLRSHTNEYDTVDASIHRDGSMHLHSKEYHPVSEEHIINIRDKLLPNSITTPIYPFKKMHLPDIVETFKSANIAGHDILVYADSTRSAELNILFQYYKIVNGQTLKLGLGMFAGDNSHNIINWNPEYRHWSEMKPWEFREWFSLFYVPWVQEWVEAPLQVSDAFLKIKNTDMLYNTKDTLLKIIDFCQLSVSTNLDSFIDEWVNKQQYIVSEFDLLDQILEHAIDNKIFAWQPISIVSEAIIQQRLRASGFEIKCDGLDTFPTDSETLYSLLERC